ncbi:hypothetical protein FAES_0391 [Fibrella aestuarina BUZ 2]|uniref:Uncharacterized protein n=1 Tax=Fibrella aestuarina BUZ 2 TaxID=1166018 RepID=I0K2Q0_9BACT|nr:hypothetical protein [Fibrella aestuarina]CCG98403.1 hypothetical protein FAES_0391 [Fibrella aestuarina BUZ 2]
MCDTIYLPNQAEVETINELEHAFGLSVDEFHLFPHLLRPSQLADGRCGREACLCYVDLAAYLTAAQATWYYPQAGPGDISVLMMPPIQRHTEAFMEMVTSLGNSSIPDSKAG